MPESLEIMMILCILAPISSVSPGMVAPSFKPLPAMQPRQCLFLLGRGPSFLLHATLCGVARAEEILMRLAGLRTGFFVEESRTQNR